MSALLRSAVIAVLCAVACAAADTQLVELKDQPWDAIITREGLRIDGTILQRRDDGVIQFKLAKDGKDQLFQPADYRSWEFRHTAKQVVAEATAQAISLGNSRRLAEIMRWGLEKDAKDAVMTAIGQALKAKPADQDVLEVAVPLWREAKDWTTLEAAARAAVRADPVSAIYDPLVVEALQQQGKQAELEAYAKTWLERNPTALTANLLCGDAFERGGDIRNARECFRKAWDLGKSDAGALGYARTSLIAGQFADARRAAQALLDAGKMPEEAGAWAAAAMAATGDLAPAKALLAAFDPAKVSARAAEAGAYALGLIAWREGRPGEAAKQWSTVQTPAAQLALAIARRREFAASDRLPETLRHAARLLNAEVRLEANQPDRALELIDPHLDGRHAFLHTTAEVLKTSGSVNAVRALAAVNSPESKRWQLYGDILAQRYDDAKAKAKAMPPNDGYAMFCRVFLLAANHDPEGARLLFESALGLPGVPGKYVELLKQHYKTADYPVVDEHFDWPEGELLPTGWEAQSPGTGIRVHAEAGKLVMDGTQTASEDPLTRAAIGVPGGRFRSARLAVDVSAAARAIVGIELLDAGKRNGVALAWRAGRLIWRQVTNGRWSEWIDLPYASTGTVAVITLDFSGGRVYAADPSDPLKREQLSDALAHAQGDWLLSLFGTAEAGVAWKAGFDDLRWQLTPDAK